MRASEIFEAAEIRRDMFSKRINNRITEIWNLAPDDPQKAITDAERLSTWLKSHVLVGEPDRERKILLRDLYDFLRFMNS